MENTVNLGTDAPPMRYIGWNTHFCLEFKIKKVDKQKFERAMEGNDINYLLMPYPCEGYIIVRIMRMTIKKAYLVKLMLKNINVYE